MPDEFAQAGGEAKERIAGLVSRHWPEKSLEEKKGLAKALLPIVEDLVRAGVPVTDGHREQCETIVLEWVNGP